MQCISLKCGQSTRVKVNLPPLTCSRYKSTILLTSTVTLWGGGEGGERRGNFPLASVGSRASGDNRKRARSAQRRCYSCLIMKSYGKFQKERQRGEWETEFCLFYRALLLKISNSIVVALFCSLAPLLLFIPLLGSLLLICMISYAPHTLTTDRDRIEQQQSGGRNKSNNHRETTIWI